MATFGGLAPIPGRSVDADGGSTLQINGNATISGALGTNFLCCGGSGNNTLNVTGTLTNNSGGSFLLYGPGDTATIGSVVNGGLIDLENDSSSHGQWQRDQQRRYLHECLQRLRKQHNNDRRHAERSCSGGQVDTVQPDRQANSERGRMHDLSERLLRSALQH